MKKGDDRKREILTTAERLFCTRGYENTAVQDILDLLHMSKGGFYHHFLSKDAVLRTLCIQRAENAAERCEAQLKAIRDPMARINKVLNMAIPLQKDELSFMTMLLPTLDSADTVAVRVAYQEALTLAFTALLNDELAVATAQDVTHPVIADAGRTVLQLLSHCWYDTASGLLKCVHRQQVYDPSALLSSLDNCRRCIETLIDAPFGTVELLRLEEWNSVAESLLHSLAPTV